MKSKARLPRVPDLLIAALALLGFAINLLLLARRYSDAAAGIAGCGGGSCEEVLASRWALIFGVPVTVFGLLVYAGLLVSLSPRFQRHCGMLLGMIAGAAAWFVFVQFVIIGKICPWCMAAHGVGIVVVMLGVWRYRIFKNMALWAVTAFLGVGLAQVYGPLPATHRIEDLSAGPPQPALTPRGEGRMVVFNGGRKTYDVLTSPRRGPVDAKHVMVEYFDYQCAACRKMAGYIDTLVAKHPDDLAVLLLPVPLDGTCNAHVSAGNQHPGSCDITRIALAVWRAKPDAFAAFHRDLIDDPSIASANRLASPIIPPAQLAAALADPWIDEFMQSNIADWHEFSKSTDKLPKLLIRDQRILHGLPTGEADFIRVMGNELGL